MTGARPEAATGDTLRLVQVSLDELDSAPLEAHPRSDHSSSCQDPVRLAATAVVNLPGGPRPAAHDPTPHDPQLAADRRPATAPPTRRQPRNAPAVTSRTNAPITAAHSGQWVSSSMCPAS